MPLGAAVFVLDDREVHTTSAHARKQLGKPQRGRDPKRLTRAFLGDPTTAKRPRHRDEVLRGEVAEILVGGFVDDQEARVTVVAKQLEALRERLVLLHADDVDTRHEDVADLLPLEAESPFENARRRRLEVAAANAVGDGETDLREARRLLPALADQHRER